MRVSDLRVWITYTDPDDGRLLREERVVLAVGDALEVADADTGEGYRISFDRVGGRADGATRAAARE